MWGAQTRAEKELKIYILRSGEIKVQCGGSPVPVSHIQGGPGSEAERETWCRDLEDSVNKFRRGLAGVRTSTPLQDTLDLSTSSSMGGDKVLLKLVLLIPARLECSVNVQ